MCAVAVGVTVVVFIAAVVVVVLSCINDILTSTVLQYSIIRMSITPITVHTNTLLPLLTFVLLALLLLLVVF